MCCWSDASRIHFTPSGAAAAVSATATATTTTATTTRPCKIPDFGLLCDLVWSDPEPDTTGWGISDRGVSYTFGNDILNKMCKTLDIDLVCRAHQVVEDGYEFECNRKIVVRYCATDHVIVEAVAVIAVVWQMVVAVAGAAAVLRMVVVVVKLVVWWRRCCCCCCWWCW